VHTCATTEQAKTIIESTHRQLLTWFQGCHSSAAVAHGYTAALPSSWPTVRKT